MAAAVEAADAAAKSANVQIIGIELSRGFGMVTVKIEGDVGAVKAAVQAGKAAAERVNRVVSTQVIARPSKSLDMLIFSPETRGQGQEKAKEADSKLKPATKPETELEPKKAPAPKSKKEKLDLAAAIKAEAEDLKEEKPVNEPTCNLCQDAACPRKKGEPHKKCIHYGEEV